MKSGRHANAAPRRPHGPRTPRIPAWAWVLGPVLVAAAVRLVAWSAQPFITVDGTQYVRVAEALMAGQAMPSVAPPGYSLLIAIARLLQPDRVHSAALVSFLCGALLPWPVWALARRRLGDGWAALPALAVAIHPELARFSAIAMSESSYLLALYGALALVPVHALGAGLAIGAAYVIRPEAIAIAALLAIRGAWRLRRRRTAIRAVVLGAAGFLALAVPCWLWYRATIGEWTLSPKLSLVRTAVTDWRAAEPRLPGARRAEERPGGDERVRAIGGNLARNLSSYGEWLPRLWPLPWVALSAFGASRGAMLETIPLAHLGVIGVLGNAEPRFLLPILPALALLAALPLPRLGRGLAIGAGVLGLAGGALLWTQGAREFLVPFDGRLEGQVDAGRWLRAHSAAGEAVVDRKPYVAFYAERPYRVMPDAGYDSLVTWIVASGARWLVVDQGVAMVMRRQLEPLLYDPAFRDRETRLELAYVGGRARGYGVGLFRVLRPGEPKSGRPPAVEARWLR